MDHAEVGSIPEIQAKHVDAAIVHEAAIGRINDEQLLKLRTLGMTEAEAENVIIENFLSWEKLKQKNNHSVGMYYFAEGVTVKVLNSYTENIESSG